MTTTPDTLRAFLDEGESIETLIRPEAKALRVVPRRMLNLSLVFLLIDLLMVFFQLDFFKSLQLFPILTLIGMLIPPILLIRAAWNSFRRIPGIYYALSNQRLIYALPLQQKPFKAIEYKYIRKVELVANILVVHYLDLQDQLEARLALAGIEEPENIIDSLNTKIPTS